MASIFRPVRTQENKLTNQSIKDGYIYVTTDTGKIYLDYKDERILLGSNGVSLFYGLDPAPAEDPTSDTSYTISLDLIEGYENCRENDLILNEPDGSFYKIIEFYRNDNQVLCQRLSVSGSGGGGTGGGGSLARSMSLKATALEHSTIVNGTAVSTTVTATSAKDDNGEYVDETLTVVWSLIEGTNTAATPYMSRTFIVNNNEPTVFNFGEYLKPNTQSTLILNAQGVNSGVNKNPKYLTVDSVELTLQQHVKFSPLTLYTDSVKPILYCTVSGDIKKRLLFIVDEEIVSEQIFSDNGEKFWALDTNTLAHGTHSVRFELYSYDNDKQGLGPDPIEFEFAYAKTGVNTPIIWTGNYAFKYFSYDKIQIPFLAYDPLAPTSTEVDFYKDAALLESKHQVIDFTTSSNFKLFEITDSTVDEKNYYYIVCGKGDREVRKEISFDVEEDTTRNMKIIENNLNVKFDAIGRSNNESTANRKKWTYTNAENVTYVGNFNNFNWYNNGWMMDEDNNTCLRISNGAQFSIPIGSMILNSQTSGIRQCTFEFQFKVRNITNYGKLIKEITRYKDDEAAFNAFRNQTEYDNYDAFLQNKITEFFPEGTTYDDLVFQTVYKDINAANAFCSYLDGKIGLALGPQDGFFSDGSDTVNVNYVEDKVVYLTVVFSPANSLISMYINGVLTSIVKISINSAVNINASEILFNSTSCDIDLYKFRFYADDLSLTNVLHNHAVDLKDILIYDQNQIAINNPVIGEPQLSYSDMLAFNKNHPDDYLMPYVIYDVTDTGKYLPYSKAVKVKGATFTFVNTGLDRAYERGELIPLAEADGVTVEEYYKHHCPSFTTTLPNTKSSGITIQVQGTSSEFYPRRNYKVKLKGSDDNINMYMHRGPFETAYLQEDESCHSEWFYYNNYTVGTRDFTMKIDYMESSGTYNMGMANFVANAYTKHPINDYQSAKAFTEKEVTYLPATSYDAEETYYSFDAAEDEYIEVEDQSTVNTGNVSSYFVENVTYNPYTWENIEDYRTSVQGFPVLGFRKIDDNYTFIGRFNMLLDKGSDEAYGFKPSKSICQKFKGNKQVRKIAECWEFSDNGRTWGSFRDPLKRKELSFSMTKSDMEAAGVSTEGFLFSEDGERVNSASKQATDSSPAIYSGPLVADTFEYRYSPDEDLLDYIYDIVGSGITAEDLAEDFDSSEYSTAADRNRSCFKRMANWEKVCKWVWSTCIDYVDAEETIIEKYIGTEFIPTTKYDIASGKTLDGYLYNTEETEYEYNYVFAQLELLGVDENMLNSNIFKTPGEAVYTKSDVFRAYAKVTGNSYISDDGKTGQFLIGTVTVRDEALAEIQKNPSQYATVNSPALAAPYVAGSMTYYFDTKEYRLAKFKQEFTEHFDLEHCLVYFLITEIFLCYDSRGKNCMMASWGPQKEGGEYIWYPIFYDIDTQLGINNTGIPSFEYYVNAHQEGCFSTNDSVLWQNLFNCFLPELQAKYKQFRGNSPGIVNINTGKTTTPLIGSSIDENDTRTGLQKAVDHIENWYLADPEECGQIVMRGARPLIALNLDEYWKYISITNPKGEGYQDRTGNKATDSSGTFFYALQGNRSLSRQQFLLNRINFIDSWWTWGDYDRAGKGIEGRIVANNKDTTSDNFIDDSPVAEGYISSPYYKLGEDGQELLGPDGYPIKTNYLDADLTVSVTPFQRSYVAIGGDNSSISYVYKDKPVRMPLPGNLPIGRRSGANYGEQLFYIYGGPALQDVGDMSTLYWTEFRANGVKRLQSLKLGSEYPGYFLKMNPPSLDASSKSGEGKPLLKDINLSNITISEDSPTIDLSSCEKLQSFRGIGSNINNVIFSEGVALKIAHLPASLTNLTLIEAPSLTNLITEYIAPTVDTYNSSWNPQEGLYIAGLTDALDTATSTNINIFNIVGGYMKYDSYKLLKTLTRIKQLPEQGKLAISLTNMDWMPYEQIVEGYERKADDQYFIDNGHYGLDSWTYTTEVEWNNLILNGKLFRYVAHDDSTLLTDVSLFETLINNPSTFTGTTGAKPEITGYVYIDNDTTLDEGYIRNTLQATFPNLYFFCKNVTKGYAANFISIDSATGRENVIGTQKISKEAFESGTTTWFESPYSLYTATPPVHYHFLGWSTTTDAKDVIKESDWASMSCTSGVYDYNFYVIYEIDSYDITFKNYDDSIIEVISIPYGSLITPTKKIPYKSDLDLELEETYKHVGYSTTLTGKVVDIETIRCTKPQVYYAIFEQANVYDSIISEEKLKFQNYTSNGVSGVLVGLNPDYTLSGKITLPRMYNNKPVLGMVSNEAIDPATTKPISFYGNNTITHIFWEKGNQVEVFQTYCCANMTALRYIEIPETTKIIAAYAFSNIKDTDGKPILYMPQLKVIGPCTIDRNAFGSCPFNNSTFTLIGEFSNIGQNAFTYQQKVSTFNFGTSSEGCYITAMGTAILRQNTNVEAVIKNINVYSDAANLAKWRGEDQYYNFSTNTGLNLGSITFSYTEVNK